MSCLACRGGHSFLQPLRLVLPEKTHALQGAIPAPLLPWPRDSQDIPLCKARGVPLLLDSSSCRVSALCLSLAPLPLLPSLQYARKARHEIQALFLLEGQGFAPRACTAKAANHSQASYTSPDKPNVDSRSSQCISWSARGHDFLPGTKPKLEEAPKRQCSPKQRSAAGFMVQEAEARLDAPTTAAIFMAPRLHLHAM